MIDAGTRSSASARAAFAALASFATACTSGTLAYLDGTGASDASGAPVASDASSDALGSTVCPDAEPPATSLECAGLYADFATKTLAASALAYAPATPLWSDGAQKSRWIELPPDTKIDVTNPDEWTFPIGTKVFKEFRVNGKRVETRMFQKTRTSYWVYAAYAWNADDTDAPISYGANVPVGDDGGTWVIPTPDECDECHRGRTDRILGFEEVGLGLPGAAGLTLAKLVEQGLIAPPPTRVSLQLGDDGTGLDGPALKWLHVNCGVTCHNANPDSAGYGAKMLLRLDPTLLDGGAVTPSWDPIRTTVGVPSLEGPLRIAPGDPADSELFKLISTRGPADQMPPVASRVVDTVDVAAIASWIERVHGPDAGMPDSGSPVDASSPDAGSPDAAPDASDADVPDASDAAGE